MSNDYRSYARMGYFSNETFLSIAIDSYLDYEIYSNKIIELKDVGEFYHENFRYYEEEEKIRLEKENLIKSTLKTVIFLTSLGQQFTENI